MQKEAFRLPAALVFSLVAALPAVARAGAQGEANDATTEPDEPAITSPRHTIEQFQQFAQSGDYIDAGKLLRVPADREGDRAKLARRLKAVFDRNGWIDPEKVSPDADGKLDDGLPVKLDQVGTIPVKGGTEPVMLSRKSDENRWVFSHRTVKHIDGWYRALDDYWAHELFPEVLLRPGPRGLVRWQWLALPVFTAVAIALGALASVFLRRLLRHVAERTPTTWDDAILARSRGPLTATFALAIGRALLPLMTLYPDGERFVQAGLRGGFLAALLWAVWRLVDVFATLAYSSRWSLEHPNSRALWPLARRVGKVSVSVVAVLLLLRTLGYPVGSVIAGLGIGGLALALASQKTVENLFGAFSLGLDQPFREGDYVRSDGFAGTVEALGLRSTRIRTLDRTLITVPNGKLAEMRLESIAARDRIRLNSIVKLVYGTTAAQLRDVLAGLEAVLRKHPKLWPDSVTVRFRELADSSLDIEVMCWFLTTDWDEFQAIRQDVLLEFMEVVARAGTTFAFPTQTVHLVAPTESPAPGSGS